MKKIAIHGRGIKSDCQSQIQALFQNLRTRGSEVFISQSFLQLNKNHFDLAGFQTYPNDLKKGDADMVMSIGGDGTLLETVTHIGPEEIPILGVNTGRLGFLATTANDEIDRAMERLFNQDYTLESRALVSLESPTDLFKGRNFALNEFAVLRKDTSSMITVKCYLNGAYLNTYWADGLMVSTPTGSTGYSLSCGGPILMPDARNFVLTPVSPHNLNIRPLVIPDEGELTFKIDSRETNLLISLDSRSTTISHDTEIKVKKADFSVILISLGGSSFIETLRNKLGWGFDRRN